MNARKKNAMPNAIKNKCMPENNNATNKEKKNLIRTFCA